MGIFYWINKEENSSYLQRKHFIFNSLYTILKIKSCHLLHLVTIYISIGKIVIIMIADKTKCCISLNKAAGFYLVWYELRVFFFLMNLIPYSVRSEMQSQWTYLSKMRASFKTLPRLMYASRKLGSNVTAFSKWWMANQISPCALKTQPRLDQATAKSGRVSIAFK